jgi:putative DNA primase/helicase
LERVTGSQAFGALARVVIVAAKDVSSPSNDAPARRFISRAKSNIGPDGGGFDYTLAQSELAAHPGLIASYVTWGTALEGTARELLGAADVNEDDDGSEGHDAADFLVTMLTGGPVHVKQLQSAARDSGFVWRTIERAKKKAGIKAKRTEGKDGHWVWYLPTKTDKTDKNKSVGVGGNVSVMGGKTASANDVQEVF